jgi:hypothetical protein
VANPWPDLLSAYAFLTSSARASIRKPPHKNPGSPHGSVGSPQTGTTVTRYGDSAVANAPNSSPRRRNGKRQLQLVEFSPVIPREFDAHEGLSLKALSACAASPRTTHAWPEAAPRGLTEAGQAAGKTKNTSGSRLSPHQGPPGGKNAAIAVGRRILEIAYYVLRDGVAYEELGANYYDEREEACRSAERGQAPRTARIQSNGRGGLTTVSSATCLHSEGQFRRSEIP